MKGTSGPHFVSTRLQQIANLARKSPEMVISTLSHHIDIHFLYEAMKRTRKDGAKGVDGVSSETFMGNYEENLKKLLEGFKSGTYRAPPVRRVHIPKGNGEKTRPIGIPTYEDKILQRAVSMVVSAVYEEEFYDFSYGFRPGKNQEQALQALWETAMKMKGGWILEVDIKGYFDNISHHHLRSFLDQRVSDGVIRRMIDKWLKAGVMEDGLVKSSSVGSPQGGVISPLLSNIYLHKVADEWFVDVVKPRLNGSSAMFRFADDIVMIFGSKQDAVRTHRALNKRMEKYGLALHPEKTKLVRFERPRSKFFKPSRKEKPGSFDFLGFTMHWGKSQRGNWVIKRKTAKDRLKRAMRGVDTWCRLNRHLKVKKQHEKLCAKVLGHYGYYGVTGNTKPILSFYQGVMRSWQRWLNRRSQGKHMPWVRFTKLLKQYPLPPPRWPKSIFRSANLRC